MIQTTEKQSQITNPMFSLIFTCQSMLRNHKPPALFSSTLGIHIHGQGHTVFENHRKSLIQHCERSVYILSGQKLIKNGKNGQFDEFD